MNVKKSFLVALASVTAVASLTAVSVSAVTPGASDSTATVDITVVEGEAATGTVTPTENAEVTVTIPADTVKGNIKFNAAVKVDVDAQKALDSLDGIKVSASEILDLYFTDENGDIVDMTGKGVEVSIKTDKYNTVYLFDNGELKDLGAKYENGVLTFTAPHFSTYVLANVEALVPTTSDTSNTASEVPTSSTPANNNTTNTGDNGFATTIAIFSIMAVVSLGTAVVATKAKKKSSK